MTANSKTDTRFRLLRLLEDKPNLTQRDIANELGISLGGVNYCLRALADKGMIKIKNFRNSNKKMAYLYVLTPKGIREKMALTDAFLKRKMEEYEALRLEIETLQQEFSTTGKLNKDPKQPKQKSGT